MSTPMRRQYLQLKKQFPETVLFFRLGDFYETFDDDAKIVSDVCGIVLTSRPVSGDRRVPMAGVPYHSADSYIAKLIEAGYKVAIAEQVEGISAARRTTMSRETTAQGGGESGSKLMHREVCRIVTPGTVVEPSLLEASSNNYLAALAMSGEEIGIAYTDITTGEFAATQVEGEESLRMARDELARLSPAELLVSKGERVPPSMLNDAAGRAAYNVTHCEVFDFEHDNARRALAEHFEVSTLDGLGLGGKKQAVRAAGAILAYLAETQKGALSQLTGFSAYSVGGFMTLDASTRRNLELDRTIVTGSVKGSLLGVLDSTVTPMGGRLLRQWMRRPLLDVAGIDARLDAVQAFADDAALRAEIRGGLKGMADLERLANRAAQGVVLPRELQSIRGGLEAIPRLLKLLEDAPPPLSGILPDLKPCDDVTRLVAEAIAEEPPATLGNRGFIRAGFSDELDGIDESAREAKEWVANLEGAERKRTGIKNLKVGFNKVFGYYLEVSKSNLRSVPPEYVRKQTLVNAERFITPQLKEYESLILNAEERAHEVEMRIYGQVCQQVAAAAPRMLSSARALARLDVYAALAEVARRNNYVRPQLTEDTSLEIIAGRHPVVELGETHRAAYEFEPFVPNDVRMSPEEGFVFIITGPNMSGKSTYLRQVALIVLMAQTGSFVPAESARIGVVDRIFTRIGAQDEIHAGQSTFMVEMVETAAILAGSTPRSLLILDEIGRGTSTYDGLAIARAVLEYVHNNPRVRARTLFATHYHELVEMEKHLPHVRNYNVAVTEDEGKVVFLHRIVPGGADKSYGIHVAQLAGVPRSVIKRAGEILEELEGTAEKPRPEGEAGTPPPLQLSMFEAGPHPVLERLRAVRLDELSPLEALNLLYEMQCEAKSGAKE